MEPVQEVFTAVCVEPGEPTGLRPANKTTDYCTHCLATRQKLLRHAARYSSVSIVDWVDAREPLRPLELADWQRPANCYQCCARRACRPSSARQPIPPS